MSSRRTSLGLIALAACLAAACSDDGSIGGDTGVSGAGTAVPTNGASDSAPTTDAPGTTGSSTSSADDDSGSGSWCIGCPKDLPSDDTCNFWEDDCPDDEPTCNIWEDDCPEGHKCTVWAEDGGSTWTGSKCVPLHPDPAGAGDPCTVEDFPASGLDNCEANAVCMVDDPKTLEGRCEPLCTGSADAPSCDDPARTCVINSSGPFFCVLTCDPLNPDACPADEGCYPGFDDPVCIPDASGPKQGAAFETCEYTNACDPGLLCANPAAVGACEEGGPGCCTPWCDLDAPACPEPTTCVPAYLEGNAPEGLESLGFCGQEEA